ncbi:hypothetical protein JCM10908_002525 [Rhodotorula pacifica]|uniref:uncharacterized protein n=1 Tax=Rhodotorula pacifica TaxID=1495444 RepID=UPI00316D2EC8
MAEFSYNDLISEGMLGFNPSPAMQIPVAASPNRFQSPQQSGASTPARGGGGGRGSGAFARGGRGGRGGGGGGYSNSPSPYHPDSGRNSPSGGDGRGRGGGAGRGAGHSGLGAFSPFRGGGRGRGSGTSSPRGGGGGGYYGASAGLNPLLVPVKFVPASGPGLGTVGGEDEHGLEKAGAEAPSPSPKSHMAADAQLAAQVGKMDLHEQTRSPPHPHYNVPETAFEPEPATTATMALDELEDAPGGGEELTRSHPGIGMAHVRRQSAAAIEQQEAALSAEPPSADVDAVEEDEPPLFEISVTRSEVVIDKALAPPTAFATHRNDGTTRISGSDDGSTDDSEEGEEIVYPARAVTRADPVYSESTTAPTRPVPATGEFTALPQSATRPPPTAAASRTAHVSQPKQPAKRSKKALKRESRAARKAGRAHARSGNEHLGVGAGGGKTLADSEKKDEEDSDDVDEEDLAEGAALFTKMQGGVLDMDDMLDSSLANDQHEDGQPRLNDSDIEWGSGSDVPPARPVHGAGARGRAKRDLQRQQRADQRQAEKLERLIAAGSTREQVELALAMEVSRYEAEEKAAEDGRAQRARAAEERRRLEQDYLANLDGAGADNMDAMAAFANGAIGSLGGSHARGDDLDRRIAEDQEEDDSDAWGTSDEDEDQDSSGSDSDSGNDDSYDSEEEDGEDTEDAKVRRLAREEEDESEEAGSSEELEMEYSLGDADGRVEHSLSLHSSDSDDEDDSSLSSSTDSAAEDLAVQSALLAGRTIKLSSMGQSGGGGRKAKRDRKKERLRARKGKMRQADYDDDEASSDDAELFAGGDDTWADNDEDFIAKMQGIVRDNADLLQTAKGGKDARRANRRERNKLFKAISNGNFDGVDLYDDIDDLDEEMIDALFADEEERTMGLGSSKKKQKRKNAGKNYGGAFSASLAEQWELDRKSKAQKKAERAAVRASAREAESRDSFRGGRNGPGGKKGKAAREAASQSNDAATINKQIRQFIQYEIGQMSMSLPPMSKKSRIAVHLLAEAYGLKSRSMGKGNNRFPVLERTSRTTIIGVSERKITAIVGTADGEDELAMGYGYGGRARGGKMSGLWKALEGASGKRSGGGGGGGGRGGGGGGIGRNSEGAVVGQGADKLGTENIGFALLKKMGWTEGGQIGLSGGIHEPVAARVKTNRQGLGSGYSVTQRQAYGMARGPSSPDSDD